MFNIEQFINSGELFDGHFKLLRTLSTDGGTADVWLAEDINTIDTIIDDEGEVQDGENQGMLVAIKIYRPKNALDIEGEQRFRDEYKIVFECRHENLLQPTSFSVFQGMPYLVLPFCKNGSSENLIGKKLTDDEIWKYISDVSAGLHRLHTNSPQIIHQDIKPANVLIDNSGNYAITDFGISSRRGGTHGFYYDEGTSGTLAYMGPERFQDETEPLPQSDIYAFGATLCEILTGTVPFGEEGGKTQVEEQLTMPELPGVSPDIKRLVYACLSKQPGDRPTAEQIMEAAKARQFPVKSRRALTVSLFVSFVLILGVAVFFFVYFSNNQIRQPDITQTPVIVERQVEEVYDEALDEINSMDYQRMSKGLSVMDSLAALDYVPAMYEIGFTYGPYSDSISLRRKDVLGIEYGKDYVPKDKSYAMKAINMFNAILEQNDSTWATLNADAAFRVAVYYVNGFNILNVDLMQGKEFLLKSREWASLANDAQKIERIDEILKQF